MKQINKLTIVLTILLSIIVTNVSADEIFSITQESTNLITLLKDINTVEIEIEHLTSRILKSNRETDKNARQINQTYLDRLKTILKQTEKTVRYFNKRYR